MKIEDSHEKYQPNPGPPQWEAHVLAIQPRSSVSSFPLLAQPSFLHFQLLMHHDALAFTPLQRLPPYPHYQFLVFLRDIRCLPSTYRPGAPNLKVSLSEALVHDRPFTCDIFLKP
jgi:hypothetical protein